MCNTRDRKYRGMAWSLQRGKTEGTKSIVSKVIYGRRGVYQFASGRCERARLPPPSLLTTLSLSPSVFSRARPTDFSYINFSTFKNKRPLLTLFLSLSLSQTAFDYLSIRDRERKDETSSRLSSMLELDRRNDKPGSKVD